MPLRRSARIHNAAEKEPVVTQPEPTVAHGNPTKRKAPAAKETENKKQATASKHVKNETAARPQRGVKDKASSLFPPEVLNMILDNVSKGCSNIIYQPR